MRQKVKTPERFIEDQTREKGKKMGIAIDSDDDDDDREHLRGFEILSSHSQTKPKYSQPQPNVAQPNVEYPYIPVDVS